MTGVGRRVIKMRRKVKPSTLGMSRSSVITSGEQAKTWRSPSSPSAARATTRIPGLASSSALRLCRLCAESTMTSTRIGVGSRVIVAPLRSWLAVHHVVAQVDELERGADVEQRLRVAEQQVAAADELLV